MKTDTNICRTKTDRAITGGLIQQPCNTRPYLSSPRFYSVGQFQALFVVIRVPAMLQHYTETSVSCGKAGSHFGIFQFLQHPFPLGQYAGLKVFDLSQTGRVGNKKKSVSEMLTIFTCSYI